MQEPKDRFTKDIVVMDPLIDTQLDAQLASILVHVQSLRGLDPTVETEHGRAMEESQCLLGALLRYRHWLERVSHPEPGGYGVLLHEADRAKERSRDSKDRPGRVTMPLPSVS